MKAGEETTQNENSEETFMGMKVLKPKTEEEEIIPEETIEDNKTTEEKPLLSDEQVSEYLKSKYEGKQFESLDDLFKPQEPTVKEVNPWEDVIDAEDEAYYAYKRETGRSRKDFEYLKEDFAEKDALEISIDRLRKETGLKLTDAQAKQRLEKELNIDLSDEDEALDNKISLNKYAKSHRESLVAEQEKYRQPLEAKLQEKAKQNVEMVTLENGKKMPKAEYDAFTEKRTSYLNNVKKAVDSVAALEVKTIIDDNGEKKELAFSYDFSNEDKHSMLSDTSDLDATINNRFQSKEGFDYKGLSQTLWRGDEKNFNKIVGAAMQQARAEAFEEFIASSNNENFSLNKLPSSVKKAKEGYVSPEQFGR